MAKLLSACGLDCPTCECYEATQSNDLEKKKDIAARWSVNYHADITAEDINCEGCMGGGKRFSWSHQCPIRACVVAKGYENCSECADFPCATNQFLYDAVRPLS